MQQIIKAPHSYMQKKISKPHIINQSKKCHKSLKPYIHLCKKNIIKHYRLGSYGSLWGVADAVGLSLGGRRWSKWRRWVSLSRSVFARRSGGGGSLSVGRHTAQSVVVVGLGRLSWVWLERREDTRVRGEGGRVWLAERNRKRRKKEERRGRGKEGEAGGKKKIT